jgi:hypothetical protein
MKPCPFCGAEVINTDGLIKHSPDCYIMVHFYSTPHTERDRKAWENRPIEDGLNEQISFEREKKIQLFLAMSGTFPIDYLEYPTPYTRCKCRPVPDEGAGSD